MNNNDACFELAVAGALLDISLDDACAERLSAAKLEAVRSASAVCQGYLHQGIREDLIFRILNKRLEMILKAESQSQLDKICRPRAPHYNGVRFVPSSEFSIPEEEMLLWSMTSLKGPLISAGYDRYMELFRQVFGGLPGEAGFRGDEALC